MTYLQSANQVSGCATQPLGNFGYAMLNKIFIRAQEACDFVVSDSVVLKPLHRRLGIDGGGEGIMQAKLPWEDVHHNLDRVEIIFLRRSSWFDIFRYIWTSIQNVLEALVLYSFSRSVSYSRMCL